jgi:hypothetical protein
MGVDLSIDQANFILFFLIPNLCVGDRLAAPHVNLPMKLCFFIS